VVTRVRADRILTLVDPAQRAVVEAGPGPLLVVAGAGTGKTRAVTARIAYQVATGAVVGGSVVAVTHSTRAAGELRDRLRRLSVDGLDRVATRTLHAAALNQLRAYAQFTGSGGEPEILRDRIGLVRAVLTRAVRSPDTSQVFEVHAEIEWAKSQLLTPGRYPRAAQKAGRVPSADPELIVRAFTGYQAALGKRGVLDYTDLLTRAAAAVAGDEAFAALVRRRCQLLIIDEYQDTDPAQEALLDAWLGSGDNLTAVGDPRQAVYGFKGADPALISRFPVRFPGARVLSLATDYRSTPEIVAVANALAASVTPPAPRGPAARAAWALTHPAPLVAAAPSGVPVVVHRCADEPAEIWVAEQVQEHLAGGVPAHQIAVLVRTNAATGPFEAELSRRGVSCWVADGDRFFDRPEIAAILTRMRDYLGETDDRGRPAFESGFSGPGLLRAVLSDFGYDRGAAPGGAGQARDIWESRSALLQLVESMPSAELLSGRALITDLCTRRDQSHSVSTDQVVLATFHRAKGLEWDVVICPRWVEGIVPSSFARTAAAVSEESHLAYVALTRARHVLLLSYPGQRGPGTTTRPSRYLTAAGASRSTTQSS
jgi:DNA helicase-2/ATP-dependent DNA helicase PcrA